MENAKIRILQVEDDRVEQLILKNYIEKNGLPFDYKAASSIRDARQVLAAEKFDVIISDHNLGDGTSSDVIAAAGGIPTIVVTGASEVETAISAIKAGASDYLVKDINQNYLKALSITVENAIGRQKTESRLHLLSSAMMSTEDGIYITDMKGTIIFVNRAFCRIYGYQEQEILGQNSSILWIQKDQVNNTRSVFNTSTAAGGWEVGFYHRRKDNSVFPVSLSRSTVKDAAKRDIAIIGVARDISERIEVEEKLRDEILQLKEKSSFLSELAEVAAVSMQKLLPTCRETSGHDNKPGSSRELNISRLTEMINNFFEISKIKTDKTSLHCTYFNFSALVKQVREAISPGAAGRNIKLESDLPNNGPMVFADCKKTMQLLRSVLNGLIRLSENNQSIQLLVRESPGNVDMEICGSGKSLQHSQIQQVFDNTEWMKPQFYAVQEDVAIGLWLAKELVEMQGGQISAHEVESGRGCVICLSIPKAVGQKNTSKETVTAVAIEYQ
jgi:PAS domain S-box-containing protein